MEKFHVQVMSSYFQDSVNLLTERKNVSLNSTIYLSFDLTLIVLTTCAMIKNNNKL